MKVRLLLRCRRKGENGNLIGMGNRFSLEAKNLLTENGNRSHASQETISIAHRKVNCCENNEFLHVSGLGMKLKFFDCLHVESINAFVAHTAIIMMFDLKLKIQRN